MTAPVDDIINRLGAIDAPSPDLDREIHLLVYPWLKDLPPSDCGGWIHPEHGKIAPPYAYTGDVHVGLGLFDDDDWISMRGNGHGWHVMAIPFGRSEHIQHTDSKTLPIALTSAGLMLRRAVGRPPR